MTRQRTEITTARPANTVYTALAGSACIAVLMALILVVLRWHALTGKSMFFGPI